MRALVHIDDFYSHPVPSQEQSSDETGRTSPDDEDFGIGLLKHDHSPVHRASGAADVVSRGGKTNATGPAGDQHSSIDVPCSRRGEKFGSLRVAPHPAALAAQNMGVNSARCTGTRVALCRPDVRITSRIPAIIGRGSQPLYEEVIMTTALLEKKLTDDAKKQATEDQDVFAPAVLDNMFTDMLRFAEDLTPFFAGIDFRRRPFFRNLPAAMTAPWKPTMEMLFANGALVVRAELPGVDKEAVKVEIVKGVLTIEGERKYEKEFTKKGYFTTECAYGTFYRQIPLPEEAKVNEAKAIFKNGVLEVTIPAPALETEVPRQLEIK
jgi:HSP20 family protein